MQARGIYVSCVLGAVGSHWTIHPIPGFAEVGWRQPKTLMGVCFAVSVGLLYDIFLSLVDGEGHAYAYFGRIEDRPIELKWAP